MAAVFGVHTASDHAWASPNAFWRALVTNRTLIYRLARREIEARYRGSVLGIVWSLIAPLTLLAVYGFVFTVIFPSKWQGGADGKGHFVLVLFLGMICFNVFSEAFNRAPTLMLNNVEYIKRVVFPLEALAWVVILVAMFNAVLSVAALMLGYVVLVGIPPISALLLPVVVVPLLLCTAGLVWFLSALGVFLRDLQQFMPVLTTVLMFFSPVFYPSAALPEKLRPFLLVSPIAVTIEEARGVLFENRWPTWWLLGVQLVIGGVVAWLGCSFFRKTRKGFADVL
ncbi:MAG: ABC transporter permease [Phycisphaerae bacterium]